MDLLDNIRSSMDLSALVIAAVGALFSIASALYLTSRKITAELRYRRVDLTRIYSENILRKRLELYPELWFHICGYAKVLRNYSNNEYDLKDDTDGLIKFQCRLAKWDNTNGLIFSTNSGVAYVIIQEILRDLADQAANRAIPAMLNEAERKVVLGAIKRCDLAMRTDIGIYEVDKLESRKIARTYREINREIIPNFEDTYPRFRKQRSRVD
jgi:hypothetical protein